MRRLTRYQHRTHDLEHKSNWKNKSGLGAPIWIGIRQAQGFILQISRCLSAPAVTGEFVSLPECAHQSSEEIKPSCPVMESVQMFLHNWLSAIALLYHSKRSTLKMFALLFYVPKSHSPSQVQWLTDSVDPLIFIRLFLFWHFASGRILSNGSVVNLAPDMICKLGDSIEVN